ncbi:MAG: hypothetical protein AAF184_17630 [Pseudomonadota bacterium]
MAICKVTLALFGFAWTGAVIVLQSRLVPACYHGTPDYTLHVTVPSLLLALPIAAAVALLEPRRPLPNAAVFGTPGWTLAGLTVALADIGDWSLQETATYLAPLYVTPALFVITTWGLLQLRRSRRRVNSSVDSH